MKMKFLLVLLSLLSSIALHGQNRKGYLDVYATDAQQKQYFQDNIILLDAIEGMYNVQVTQQSGNAYRTFPVQMNNITLVVCKTSDGLYNCLGGTYSIEQIGETNAYKFIIPWNDINYTDIKRFHLNEQGQFRVSFEIPIRQMQQDMGRNYQSGMYVKFTFDFIKQYPTYSMYKHAYEQLQIEEQQNMIRLWNGSGFALREGYVVTNYHVVEKAKDITIQGVNGDFSKKHKAILVASDKHNDLAILRVNDANLYENDNIPYGMKESLSDVGEDIFVLGYPLTATMGEEVKLTTGVISSKTGFQGDVSLYQISAPIQPGNSGGPLFDNKGNLIGIVSSKHSEAENAGYAVKAAYLNNLIESTLSPSILPTTNQTANSPLTVKVAKIKNFVYIINCSNQ